MIDQSKDPLCLKDFDVPIVTLRVEGLKDLSKPKSVGLKPIVSFQMDLWLYTYLETRNLSVCMPEGELIFLWMMVEHNLQ